MSRKFSITIVVCVAALVCIGLVMIYSASSYVAELQLHNSLYYVKKQLGGVIVGIALFVGAMFFDIQLLKKYRVWILIISYILLALVFIPGLGVESYGAVRWINLGFTTIQPSEISKFGLIIYIASYMTDKDMTLWRHILVVLALSLGMCLLIMLEPNMSITMCVLLSVFVLLVSSGLKFSQIAIIAVPALIGVIALILLEPYRFDRLLAFIDPWASAKDEGYQLIQSYYAIGNGGLFGVGLFNSRQKYLFLPFAESDFIFSIICEELGLIGAIVVIGIFAVLIVSGIVIALRAKDAFRCYLAIGIVAIIAVQTLVNIAVVSGSMPPTGLPLPFVSAGGSAVAIFMGATGLLVNIDKNSQSKVLRHSI